MEAVGASQPSHSLSPVANAAESFAEFGGSDSNPHIRSAVFGAIPVHARSNAPQNVAFVRGRWRSCSTARERFEQKFIPEPMSGCFLWEGATSPAGYGNFGIDGRVEKAHRAAWRIYRGPIPQGLVVRHKCDNPHCVRIEHLELGTPKDNVADCHRRGRARHVGREGERNHRAKLTEGMAREVFALARAPDARISEIARRFGLSPTVVYKIRDGELWAFATGADGPMRGFFALKGKLTSANVCAIRARIGAGETNESIAGDFGVTAETIKNIRIGKTWTRLAAITSSLIQSGGGR